MGKIITDKICSVPSEASNSYCSPEIRSYENLLSYIEAMRDHENFTIIARRTIPQTLIMQLIQFSEDAPDFVEYYQEHVLNYPCYTKLIENARQANSNCEATVEYSKEDNRADLKCYFTMMLEDKKHLVNSGRTQEWMELADTASKYPYNIFELIELMERLDSGEDIKNLTKLVKDDYLRTGNYGSVLLDVLKFSNNERATEFVVYSEKAVGMYDWYQDRINAIIEENRQLAEQEKAKEHPAIQLSIKKHEKDDDREEL